MAAHQQHTASRVFCLQNMINLIYSIHPFFTQFIFLVRRSWCPEMGYTLDRLQVSHSDEYNYLIIFTIFPTTLSCVLS